LFLENFDVIKNSTASSVNSNKLLSGHKRSAKQLLEQLITPSVQQAADGGRREAHLRQLWRHRGVHHTQGTRRTQQRSTSLKIVISYLHIETFTILTQSLN